MSTADFPKRLPEKVRQIRERYRLTPDQMAPHVHAKDGAAISAYESGEDMPVSVLIGYWKFMEVLPLENFVADDRDLWFGHLPQSED
ncbi:MAG TPA: hypothetical protein VJ875_02310 [Pyrinomonadaceae bacterium]|nr:hypothetical protein [Pyrinomonadaceae bacterium]